MPTLTFPFATPECESRAGTCKCALALPSDSRSAAQVVYIGDGRSDRCVSGKIQTVFAKGALREWCDHRKMVYEPFDTLTDVTERLFPQEV